MLHSGQGTRVLVTLSSSGCSLVVVVVVVVVVVAVVVNSGFVKTAFLPSIIQNSLLYHM
jgi:hypothetical protein